MELSVRFPDVRFPATVLRRAIEVVSGIPNRATDKPGRFLILKTSEGEETWNFTDPEDFFAKYESCDEAHLNYRVDLKSEYWECRLDYSTNHLWSSVEVSSEVLNEINLVMNVFRGSRSLAIPLPRAEQEIDQKQEEDPFNIFIGHGRSDAWRQLANHLRDKHDLDVIAYESGARAGHSIRDILEEMLDNSSMAFLVHTGEDETADGKLRARQNVVHETGLFQGRLGFPKAVVLLEEGVEDFSNLAGVQYISFQKGHINGTFGEVLATIKREQKRRSLSNR